MARASLDRHFRRFRNDGDVASLAEVFDEVAPEMLRVARHLAPPSIEAQDLVQNTFLVAIQRAGAYDPDRPVKQWLLGILAKEAAYERRRGSRVVEVDRVSTHAEPDPLDRAEDVEFTRALDRALAELPEKYRNVVRPVLLEGKNPREVAQSVGQRPGTVRVQLHRGLRLLRDALPAGFALGALVATHSPGLGAVRTKVLLGGAGRDAALLQVAGGSALLGTFLASRTRAVLTTAALAASLGGLAYLGLRGEGVQAALALPEIARSEADTDTELALGGRELREPAAPIGDSLAGDPAGAPAAAIVAVQATGRVLGLDYQPAVGAEVELDIQGAGRFVGSADSRGEFRVSVVLGAGQWAGVLRARGASGHADVRPLMLRSDRREAYLGTLMLGEAGPVSVRVEDPSGRSLAGAEVEVISEGSGLVSGKGRTGVGGALRFPAIPRGRLEVRASLDGRAGAVTRQGPRLRSSGIAVRLDRPLETASAVAGPAPLDGEAPAGSGLVLRLASPAGPVWKPSSGFLTAGVPLRSRPNADGEVEVELEGVDAGESVLLNVAAQGFRPVTQRVTLREPGLPNPVDVRLDPYASLLASLPRDPELRVELELQRFDPQIGDFGPTGLDWGGLMLPNTPEGLFRFDGLTPGTYRLRERGSDLCSEPFEVGAESGVLHAELDLTVLRRVEGRVVVPDRGMIHQVSVVVDAEGLDDSPNRWTPRQRFQWTVRPNEQGRFSLLVPGDRSVRISAYHPSLVPSAAGGSVELGEVTGELVLELVQGDEIELALHDLAQHHTLDRLRVFVYAPGASGEPLARLYPRVEAGVARFAGVAPGRFDLWVDPGSKTRVQPFLLRDVQVTQGRTLTLAEPAFERGGSVVLQTGGIAASHGPLTLFARSHGQPDYVRTSSARGAAGGPVELTGLGPGTFTVFVQSPQTPGPLHTEVVHIEAGGTATLTLD